VETLVVEPASRWDVIIDFSNLLGERIIMKNIGGDEPFGGDIPGPQLFSDTDKIMAFDVLETLNLGVPDDFDIDASFTLLSSELVAPDNTRRVGLFEGHDQFGRLQPLLGTVDKATDMNGDPINYPNTDEFKKAGLTGQMEGTMAWHYPTTENIKLGAVEEWEIWNLSADAHPMHLHMVQFQLVSRKEIIFDGFANEGGEIEPGDAPAGNGTFTTDMPLLQHDGSMGEGYRVVNPTSGDVIPDSNLTEYIHNFPMDTIVALPGQVTTIRATFDKPGRYNWHCHILAHEDHEMMRIFHVGPLPDDVMVRNASSSTMANVRGWTALVGGLLLLVFV
jgi:FtsP/CotA-like multicopper oxidase with cupredoxin domain